MDKQEYNKTIEKKISVIKKLNLPIEDEKVLIAASSFNPNPNDINPLLDQYPFDLTNNKGIFVHNIISKIVHVLRRRSGLKDIFGGYVLLEQPIDSFTNIGGTSTVGMNIEEIKNDIDSGKKMILGYIAIPIDDADFLIENQSINDWSFQERYLDVLLDCGTVAVGALGWGKGKRARLRTLKFTMDVNLFTR